MRLLIHLGRRRLCGRLLGLGLRLGFMIGRSISRSVLVLGGATALARVSTASFRRTTHSLDTFRCPTRGTQCAFQISLSTSGAWELLVAFCFRLGTVAAGNGCATGRFGYPGVHSQLRPMDAERQPEKTLSRAYNQPALVPRARLSRVIGHNKAALTSNAICG